VCLCDNTSVLELFLLYTSYYGECNIIFWYHFATQYYIHISFVCVMCVVVCYSVTFQWFDSNGWKVEIVDSGGSKKNGPMNLILRDLT
jgi:hypothetical protein